MNEESAITTTSPSKVPRAINLDSERTIVLMLDSSLYLSVKPDATAAEVAVFIAAEQMPGFELVPIEHPVMADAVTRAALETAKVAISVPEIIPPNTLSYRTKTFHGDEILHTRNVYVFAE